MFSFKIDGFDIVDIYIYRVDRHLRGTEARRRAFVWIHNLWVLRRQDRGFSSIFICTEAFVLSRPSSRKDFVHLVDPEGANYATFSNRPSDRLTKVCRWEKDASFGYTSSSRLGLFHTP